MTREKAQETTRLDRRGLEMMLIEKARTDRSFRRDLLKDPRKAIEGFIDVRLPADMEIVVVEETPSRFCLVLPVNPEELSDEELEKAAGGTTTIQMNKGMQQLLIGG